MTAKHFKAIAETLNDRIQRIHGAWTRPYDGSDPRIQEVEAVAIELANQFEQFNPNFNRSKFLAVALA